MKAVALSLLITACGPAAKEPDLPNMQDAEYAFSAWVSDHRASTPEFGLYEITKLFERASDKDPKIATKIVNNLYELEYIKESSNLDLIGDRKRLGVCFFGGDRSFGVDVLDKAGFEAFNRDYFGDEATEETLNAS